MIAVMQTKFDYPVNEKGELRKDLLSKDGKTAHVVIFPGFHTLRTFGDNGNLKGLSLLDYQKLIREGRME